MRHPVFLLLLACRRADTDDAPTYAPDLHCPGDAGGMCDDAEGPLLAGVAEASILPACFESWLDESNDAAFDDGDVFLDCGCDRLCADDPGYPGADDGEGDGEFQASFIAGFGFGRAATGVRGADVGLRGEGDGLYAQALVLRKGDTTLAIVTADLVGWFYDDVLAVRERVAERGIAVDHVIVHSSHNHQAPDTMGLYGPELLDRGYDPAYQQQLRDTFADLVEQAAADLATVELVVGRVSTSDYHDNGVANVVGDTRDPWVVDDDVHAAQLVTSDGHTLATLIHWANHPETRGSDNTLFTADYVHALRETVEDGVSWGGASREGVGGVAMFLNGTVGGLMTSLHVSIEDPDGNLWADGTWEKADANGQLVGEMALDALASGHRFDDVALSFRSKSFLLPVENIGFQTMMLLDVMQRAAYDYNPDLPLDETNIPKLLTEVDVVELGPVQILTVPGELLPELAIGGYDGSQVHTPVATLIDPANPNPPDLSQAPTGPYLEDLLAGEYRLVVGLGNDEIGYIIPGYDFVLDPDLPYILQPDGDHYEESNSLGPNTGPLVDAEARALLAWER